MNVDFKSRSLSRNFRQYGIHQEKQIKKLLNKEEPLGLDRQLDILEGIAYTSKSGIL
jgi:hypothetical protein